MVARRRVRELTRGPALALNRQFLESFKPGKQELPFSIVLDADIREALYYDDPRNPSPDTVFVWAFTYVVKDRWVLSYRLGRYRDDHDSFRHKRTIGFKSLVTPDDCDLLNYHDFGIRFAGVRAATIDLDAPTVVMNSKPLIDGGEIKSFILAEQGRASNSEILANIELRCPSWFEPTKRRLAMNNIQWIDLSVPPNNIDDFEPWSQLVLNDLCRTLGGLQDL